MHMAPIRASSPVAEPVTLTLTVPVKAKRLKLRVQLPAGPVTQPPLLALHGISRQASAIEAAFGPHCAEAGRVLIVPRFSRRDWRHFQTVGKHRADKALLAALSYVEGLGLAPCQRVSVFGYSGGAQLAHRFAMLYPQRVASLHVAAAGWYCLADPDLAFPLGLGGSAGDARFDFAAAARSQLPGFLGLPLRVYVGAEDRQRDPALRQNPDLNARQGPHRVARARAFADQVIRSAKAQGLAPDVTFTELPGCAHDFAACARAGLDRLVCNEFALTNEGTER